MTASTSRSVSSPDSLEIVLGERDVHQAVQLVAIEAAVALEIVQAEEKLHLRADGPGT